MSARWEKYAKAKMAACPPDRRKLAGIRLMTAAPTGRERKELERQINCDEECQPAAWTYKHLTGKEDFTCRCATCVERWG